METTSTSFIVAALTRAVVEHRLQPGAKLVEQKLADEFGVSRTLVRQALYQLSQNRLVRIEPARGAFVAAPSATEAAQVFAVRRILETGMVRAFVEQADAAAIDALQQHIGQERAAVSDTDVAARTALLGDFHVRMARLLGNAVLADLLTDLNSRSALITLMYQSTSAATHSHEEHGAIMEAICARDAALAVQRMESHLHNVESALTIPPTPQPRP